MLSFLDRVPPDDAVRLRSEPDSDAVMAWKYNGKHYVRTTHSLMWHAQPDVAGMDCRRQRGRLHQMLRAARHDKNHAFP